MTSKDLFFIFYALVMIYETWLKGTEILTIIHAFGHSFDVIILQWSKLQQKMLLFIIPAWKLSQKLFRLSLLTPLFLHLFFACDDWKDLSQKDHFRLLNSFILVLFTSSLFVIQLSNEKWNEPRSPVIEICHVLMWV